MKKILQCPKCNEIEEIYFMGLENKVRCDKCGAIWILGETKTKKQRKEKRKKELNELKKE